MAHINKLKCHGLYSFSNPVELEFSDKILIVGPNNSGKSNIVRTIQLFVDTFYRRRRLEDYEISHPAHDATLEIDFNLSDDETSKIVDYFSFRPDAQKNGSVFYEYQNYELLKKLLDVIHVKLTWKKEIEGHGSESYVELEFTKCGLTLFNPIYSDFQAFNKFPTDVEHAPYNDNHHLIDVLSKLTEENPKQQLVTIFDSEIKGATGLSRLRITRNDKLSDKAKRTIRNLFSYMSLSLTGNQEISFSELLGSILKNGIQFSSDGRGINNPTILDYAEMLKIPPSTSNQEKSYDFNAQLESQAFSKIMSLTDELKSDGSNVAQFLFSLKNSQKHTDRTKFDQIQKVFEEIFRSDDLSFDVILQYEVSKKFRVWNSSDTSKPKLPAIIIFDKKTNKQISLRHVGAGLSEIIYLLSSAYGVENSLILLDEPSVNLHPPLMRTLMKRLQNVENNNQFVIITHSPEVVSFQLFENKAKIFYIRKKNDSSLVKTLEGDVKEWFEQDRNKLKHQIDTRIFFGKTVILTEGDSDKNLLSGLAEYWETIDSEMDLSGNDVIITSIGGKKNFQKYIKLLKTFEIPYLVLADSDAKNLFETSGIITKNTINGDNSVFIIEGGNLEFLMNEINSKAFNEAKNDSGDSKPALAYNFAKKVSTENPTQLKPLCELLKKSVKLARGENDS